MDKIKEIEDIQKLVIDFRTLDMLTDPAIYQFLQLAYNAGRIKELDKKLKESEDSRS